MGVIDFHSHILPGIDDGSRNVETSIGMLWMCKEHGVDTMIATPHFMLIQILWRGSLIQDRKHMIKSWLRIWTYRRL